MCCKCQGHARFQRLGNREKNVKHFNSRFFIMATYFFFSCFVATYLNDRIFWTCWNKFHLFLKNVITPELTITYSAHAVFLLVLTLLCKWWRHVCAQSLHLSLPMKRTWGDQGEAQWSLSYTEASQAGSSGHFLLFDFKKANISGVLVPARGSEVPTMGTKGCGDQRVGSELTSPGCQDSAIYALGLSISSVRYRWQVSPQDDACTQRHLNKCPVSQC